MYRFIYPSKDTYIYELNTNSEKNFGGDDNLALKKDFDGATGLNGVSRILLHFDLSELSQSITDGDIFSGSKYYLRLYEQKTSELSPTYSLASFPLSQSWEGGTGYTIQDPNSRDGVSWERTDESFDNNNWSLVSNTNADSGSRSVSGGGVWITGSGESVQSFSYESPDVNMDVTDIVNNWLDGTIPNNGLILKWSGSQEDSSDISGDINFFSSNANSIYSPKIEVRWDDKAGIANDYSITFVSESNHYMTTNYNPTFGDEGGQQQLTYMFWWKSSGNGNDYGHIFSHHNNTTTGYGSFFTNYGGNEPRVYLKSSYAIIDWTPPTGKENLYKDGQWHHWLFCAAGNTSQSYNDWKLFVDGEEWSQKTPSATHRTQDANAWGSLQLGGQSADNTTNPDGLLDEFAVYSGSITSSTAVSRIYNNGTPVDLMSSEAISDLGTPLLYFQMEAGSGRINDSTDNGFYANLQNSPPYSTDTPGMAKYNSTSITTDGTKDNYVYVTNLRKTYKETEIPRIRVNGRERYQTKSVSTTKSSTSYNYLPDNRSWYSIIDVETGETLVPFGDNSKLSQDVTSHYFNLNLKEFIVNRLYRILIRIEMDDGRYRIFDDNFDFKVVS